MAQAEMQPVVVAQQVAVAQPQQAVTELQGLVEQVELALLLTPHGALLQVRVKTFLAHIILQVAVAEAPSL
jgi:hypothetical protein